MYVFHQIHGTHEHNGEADPHSDPRLCVIVNPGGVVFTRPYTDLLHPVLVHVRPDMESTYTPVGAVPSSPVMSFICPNTNTTAPLWVVVLKNTAPVELSHHMVCWFMQFMNFGRAWDVVSGHGADPAMLGTNHK